MLIKILKYILYNIIKLLIKIVMYLTKKVFNLIIYFAIITIIIWLVQNNQ